MVKAPTKTPEQYESDRLRGFEQQALGEWLIEQRDLGRKSLPISEIDLVIQGILIGVKHAGGSNR